MLKQREKNAKAIRKTIEELESIKAQKIPQGFTHSHYICAAVLEQSNLSVEDVVEKLRKKNIGARQIYSTPCHQQPTYLEGIKEWRWNNFIEYPNYSSLKLPITEKIAKTHFEIPIHPGVTEDELIFMQESLTEIFK
jgi:dTDP-4-amino-4,6-dideoxygalactose transaminase